jgi:cytochrome o ubiquinol oxidase subunit 2
MIRTMKRFLLASVIPLTLTGLVAIGWWLFSGVNMDVLNPSGDIALQQRRILFITLSLAGIVVIPVFAMLIGFVWRYRHTNTKAHYDADWNENKWLEIIWWGIPIIIISILAVITWQSSHSLDPYRPIESKNKTVPIQVVALQWKWLFIYPEQNLVTVNHIVVPEKTPLHFTLTADAPMSAFWVPSLGSQIYAMNGMKSQLNLIANHTGIFDGYNTNINGKGYSNMKFTVEAKTDKGFNEWVTHSQHLKKFDQAAYNKLAEPESAASVMAYRLDDTKIFDNVVRKYMHSTSKAVPPKQPEEQADDTHMHENLHDTRLMEAH